jgi:hypothetical protein
MIFFLFQLRMLNDTLPLAVAADDAVVAAKKAKRPLTDSEQALVDKVAAAANVLIQVDTFERLGAEKNEAADYVRPALRNTKFAAHSVGASAAAAVAVPV